MSVAAFQNAFWMVMHHPSYASLDQWLKVTLVVFAGLALLLFIAGLARGKS
ncbi:MAG: hypothetical protein NVSMB26_29340 [Beijerinckiaceae bacterium]